MEEVCRFARYSGAAEEVVTFAASRLWRLSRFESGQRALKFYELARTGHTTLSILDLADELLAKSRNHACPKARHRLRQHAAILGIFAVAPLRNASAELVLGETLFWEGAEWVIDMPIQKTEGRNPEQFVYPLAAQHGAFIDAVILGGYASKHLPALRGTAIATRRPLFVHFDGSPTGRTFIPRSFKEITDNSFTTLRTMLHTDLGIAGSGRYRDGNGGGASGRRHHGQEVPGRDRRASLGTARPGADPPATGAGVRPSAMTWPTA
jgi:hypothetical protein